MKHGQRFWIGTLVTAVLAMALALPAAGGQGALALGTIIYVDADATGGTGDCASWANACLQLYDALDMAVSGDQIWVAKGTYKPTSGTDRTLSFQMIDGVAIYGGFDPPDDDTWEERDWEDNVTILSGDLLGNDGSGFINNDENSYHVVRSSGATEAAVLDGFTVSGGNADGSVDPDYNGGGMYNYESSPTLTNCVFSGNSASNRCGGMCNDRYSSPTLTNCTFDGNSADYGGGMYNYYYSSPTLTNCTFSSNSAHDNGGGMNNMMYSSPTLTNCTFQGNYAIGGSGDGGGMFNMMSSSPTVTNCTFSGNSASSDGGAMYNSTSSPTVTNSIFWANSPDQITNSNSSPLVAHSDIQGGYTGTGNIAADPLFVDPANGDFHLGTGSPCIDAGDNAAPSLPLYDFEGDNRVLDGDGDGMAVVDMGVDEFVYGGQIVIEVEIDIRPGSEQNIINLGSHGIVSVAILTTGQFEASTVDPGTVLFAGAPVLRSSMRDVDHDDDLDMILHFEIQVLDLNEGSTEATLTGATLGGTPIEGTDAVRIIP